MDKLKANQLEDKAYSGGITEADLAGVERCAECGAIVKDGLCGCEEDPHPWLAEYRHT